MPLPAPVEALWNDLQSVRTRLLEEVEGLSQAQADWRTSDQDWSVGEIPADLKAFAPLATPAGGRAEAPRPCGRSAASLLLSWSRR